MKHLDSNSTNKRTNQRAAAPRRTRLALTLAGALSCAALTAPAANANHNDTPHSAGNPDRAYELVSPSYKIAGLGTGVNYTGPGSAGPSGFAAYDGERFAVQGTWGSTLLESAFSYANDWAFAERQDAQAGWVSHSPVTRGGYESQNYRFLIADAANDDLSLLSWRSNGGQLALFAEQGDWTGTAVSDWVGNWELFAPLGPIPPGTGGTFRTVNVAAGADVVAGSGRMGGLAGPGDPTHPSHSDLIAGETAYVYDLSAGVSDTFPGVGARSVANVCTGAGSERTEIPVELAGGLLGAQPCPDALPGRDARLISDHGASMGTGATGTNESPVSLKNVVSRDGSRVFFMSPDPGADRLMTLSPCGTVGDNCPPQLYVWQRNPDGTVVTRWISRPEVAGQAASLLGQARFEGASEDGSRVFFRTASPLTADDPNGMGLAPPPGGVVTGDANPNSWDLYMYEFPTAPGADPDDGDLTRISAGPPGGGIGDCNSPGPDAGDPDEGPAALRFVSRDGSRVYFACAGPLADVAGSSDPRRVPGRATPAGDPTVSNGSDTNLYLYDANQAAEAQRWRFIARLPRSRGKVVAACASTGARDVDLLGSTGGSGGGVGVLTSSVNCVRGRSDGGFVTFWTDGSLTVDDGADGLSGDMYGYDAASDELVRLSAPEGGVASPSYTCLTVGEEADQQCFGDPGLGFASGKASLGVVTDPANGSDRVAFFQSRSRLVAEDSDGAYDVYEWRNGDLSLVTTGASDTDGAFYRGNDRSGRNVFFATQDALTWQDVDVVLDVYSARVGGGVDRPVAPVACVVLADACQGGGAGLAPVAPKSVAPGGGDASPGVRRRLSIGRLGARARRRAARSGVLRLGVKTNSAGVLRAGVRARVGKRSRKVAGARRRVTGPGRVVVRLRLSAGARRVLREQRVLRVTVRVAQQGARGRTATVTLRRGKRS